eukprot:NODE_3172_length_1266_cov_33.979878_g3012_i0.p1 GENE.NODE_3172_length_1266_cov_33.979878_g3012_i0~~NODE_3172_length_1266_cov_33.979878_g3012_i0.p1  ORF type:complete len:340 (-),score=36.93 NODE_3172_length_1266_cov_33.979878_g3012_i0:143-1162(-)
MESGFNRHYVNIHKEARRLAKFKIYDPEEDRLRKDKKKGLMGKVQGSAEVLSRTDYFNRIGSLLSTFANKDNAVLLSMSGKLHSVAEKAELVEILSTIKAVNRQILTARKENPLSEEDAVTTVDSLFKPMESVFSGNIASSSAPDAIERLLGGGHLHPDEVAALSVPMPTSPPHNQSTRSTSSNITPPGQNGYPARSCSVSTGPSPPQTSRSHLSQASLASLSSPHLASSIHHQPALRRSNSMGLTSGHGRCLWPQNAVSRTPPTLPDTRIAEWRDSASTASSGHIRVSDFRSKQPPRYTSTSIPPSSKHRVLQTRSAAAVRSRSAPANKPQTPRRYEL